MEIGKIPTELLEKIILNPINNINFKRDDIIIRPSTGEDCSAVDLNGELLVISTDPITGSDKNCGYLAVHINCNDVASSGAEPIGILLTVLLPKDSHLNVLEEIMDGAYKAARELKIEILGGHTEVTEAVNKPIISGTIIGKTKNKNFISSAGAKIGQDVIMTKWAGIEGTSIIASDYEEKLSKVLSKDIIETAKGFIDFISVVQDGLIAGENGATSMHDVTEGGILGAAWEIAHCSNVGIDIFIDDIPLMPETIEICKIAKINPYRLISSGSMIITCSDGLSMVDKLNLNGIKSTIIGKITKESKNIIYKNGHIEELTEPVKDEIYNVQL